MRTAYFDCFSGAAGDMLLAALIDAGCPLERVRAVVGRLGLAQVVLSAARVQRHGLAALHVSVTVDGVVEGESQPPSSHGKPIDMTVAAREARDPHHLEAVARHHHQHHIEGEIPVGQAADESQRPAHGPHAHGEPHHHHLPGSPHHNHEHPIHPHEAADDVAGGGHSHDHEHRHLAEIERIIRAAGLAPAVRERSIAVFRRLAEAEATVHGCAANEIHFHEVGANDAIVDIVGVVAALDLLGIEQVMCSPIPTGSGTVRCAHGVIPVPAPATAQLLRGFPIAACDEPGELCTPTGAAILTSLAEAVSGPPAMRLTAVGVGAGTREGKTRPNILRVLIGETSEPRDNEIDTVTVIEAQVDDCTGQALGFAMERLLAAGALDVYVVPILMKKGRPGHLMTVLAKPDDAAALERILFSETSTFGVRRFEAARSKLRRRHETVDTEFGPIRVKVGVRGDQELQAWPEYEDCAAAARNRRVAIKTVQHAALAAWKNRAK